MRTTRTFLTKTVTHGSRLRIQTDPCVQRYLRYAWAASQADRRRATRPQLPPVITRCGGTASAGGARPGCQITGLDDRRLTRPACTSSPYQPREVRCPSEGPRSNTWTRPAHNPVLHYGAEPNVKIAEDCAPRARAQCSADREHGGVDLINSVSTTTKPESGRTQYPSRSLPGNRGLRLRTAPATAESPGHAATRRWSRPGTASRSCRSGTRPSCSRPGTTGSPSA